MIRDLINRAFWPVTIGFLVVWFVIEIAVYRSPVTTWTCSDGIGEPSYTYTGDNPPHMDCSRN